MLSWIIAALVGAVPLYFGFNHGRARQGLPWVTSIGVLLSVVVLGLMVATNATGATLVLPALFLSYVAGIAAMGITVGGLVRLVMGDGPGSSTR